MTRWAKSLMDTYRGDGASYSDPCVVVIEEGVIDVTYGFEDGCSIRYHGKEHEPGHFQLQCPGVQGKATLHRFARGNRLEGWWNEEGHEGMWCITLRN